MEIDPSVAKSFYLSEEELEEKSAEIRALALQKLEEVKRSRAYQRRRKGIDHHYGKNLPRKYGITMDDYQAMLRAQDGKCAICGREPRLNRRLVVDHDHDSGKVRGLLCSNCNTGLGNFRDSIAALKKAIEYLKSSEK